MKVVIVDDDQLVAISLRTILEADESIEVVGCGNNGKEAVKLYQDTEPDVLLMDIRMDIMSGLEAGELILKKEPGAKILFLTTFSDDEYIVKALSIGARGYILKQDFEGIVPALKAVMKGQSVFGGEIVNKIPGLITSKPKLDLTAYQITPKEEDVIAKVAQGLSNKEIADSLYLSEGTVRNYISIILDKLDLRDRTQLAVFYLSR